MSTGAREPYLDWILKAQDEERLVEYILSEDSFISPACFHSQQCAEMALKALIEYCGLDVPKSHDLVQLVGILDEEAPRFKEQAEDLKRLTSYYIVTRYPGDYPEFQHNDAVDALKIATRVKELVIQEIEKRKKR